MTTTIRTTRIAIMLTAAALVTAAQAQTYRVPYGQPPLYPYVAAQQQPYAVEVAPGVYVIQRPAPLRAYPYVREQSAAEDAKPSDRPSKPADRALIEELRKRYEPKETTIETKKVVREAPVVRETTRVVDDPPRVIERRHIVEDAAAPSRRSAARRPPSPKLTTTSRRSPTTARRASSAPRPKSPSSVPTA